MPNVLEALQSFQTSGTTHPMTQHNILEDLNVHTFGHIQLLTIFITKYLCFITSKTFILTAIFVTTYQFHRKLKMYTHQWQEGGTSFVSSSNDFSDLYSWTKDTVTTIIIAWKEMFWLHYANYIALHLLTVPSDVSQTLCQNQNKSCTVQSHIYGQKYR